MTGPTTKPPSVFIESPHPDTDNDPRARSTSFRPNESIASVPMTTNTVTRSSAPSSGGASLDNVGLYAMNKYTLSFLNDETELRYTQFSFIHSGFYGGKMWHLVSIVLFVYFTIVFHPLGVKAGPRILADPRYILVDITVVSSTLTFLCLFVERLYPYREYLLLISFVSHWPAAAIMFTIGKNPEPWSYSVCLACYFFCTFLTQVRFSRLFPFLTITPLLTLIVLVTTQKSYFETHAVSEIAFWPAVFFPMMLLRAFEIRNRKNFETMERSERRVEQLGLKVAMVQSMVANFFPPTPTIDLLVPKTFLGSGEDCDDDDDVDMQGTTPRKYAWSNADSPQPLTSALSLRYTNTAMIVTDLAGFTQWTASCADNPSVVIKLLTKMFLNIDHIMPRYKVEKIATVGDAFIGVIFDNSPNNPQKIGMRASHAIQFGCDILHTASKNATGSEHSLKMRVGVHVGTVVGGFVGTSPPKFDCFGSDFEIAKLMESSGRPAHVHASRAAVAAATQWESTYGEVATCEHDAEEQQKLVSQFCRRSPSYECTSDGVLCRAWEWIADSVPAPVDLSPAINAPLLGHGGDDGDPEDDPLLLEEEAQDVIKESAMHICEALVQLRHGGDGNADPGSALSPIRDGISSIDTPQQVDPSSGNFDRNNEEKLANDNDEQNDGEDASTDDFNFHPVLLEFKNPSMERHFKTTIVNSDIQSVSYAILAMLQFVLVFAHAVNGCQHTLGNRLVLGGCIVSTAIWIGFVHRFGVRNYAGIAVVLVCSHLPYFFCTFQTTDCDIRGSVLNVANIYSSYFVMATISTQFTMLLVLKFRFLLLAASILFAFCLAFVHIAVVGEGVVSYDINLTLYFSVLPVFGGISYFIDFSMRSSFSSARKLNRLLASAKGRHAEMAAQAMDIMLPSFVSEAIAQSSNSNASVSGRSVDSDDEHNEVSSESTRKPLTASIVSESNSSATSSKPVFDLDVLQEGMVWEYPTVVVMFIKFTPTTTATAKKNERHVVVEDHEDDAHLLSEDYEEINSLMIKLEHIIAKHQVQKVKSIGNTLLTVAGIDEFCFEPFMKTFRAALEAKSVLQERSRFTIGISSGACFGAVVGVKGLCFDIFGDTVNTASRMCSTAATGTIQLPDLTRMAALVSNQVPPNATLAEKGEPVIVKGKGAMNVYQLSSDAN